MQTSATGWLVQILRSQKQIGKWEMTDDNCNCIRETVDSRARSDLRYFREDRFCSRHRIGSRVDWPSHNEIIRTRANSFGRGRYPRLIIAGALAALRAGTHAANNEHKVFAEGLPKLFHFVRRKLPRRRDRRAERVSPA